MATIYTAAQHALKHGFTHVISASGEFAPLASTAKGTRASPNAKRNGWGMANLDGVGQCIIHMSKPGKIEGYYRLANITNGYTTLYNSLCDTFQVSHPEIGACIAEFKELSEAIEYAQKG